MGENNLIYQMKISLALKQRKIFLNDYVTEDSIFECIYYLHRLMDLDNKTGEKEPIEIYVNSNGGLLTECMGLISLIEQMKDDGYCIITINSSKAYSAGFFISLVGSIRKSYRRAEYMYHSLSAGTIDTLQNMIEDVEHFKKSQAELHSLVKKYSNIPIDELAELDRCKIDKFYTPEEMLKYNAIDIIL